MMRRRQCVRDRWCIESGSSAHARSSMCCVYVWERLWEATRAMMRSFRLTTHTRLLDREILQKNVSVKGIDYVLEVSMSRRRPIAIHCHKTNSQTASRLRDIVIRYCINSRCCMYGMAWWGWWGMAPAAETLIVWGGKNGGPACPFIPAKNTTMHKSSLCHTKS